MFAGSVKEGFTLLEFVRFFLNIVPHQPMENLHLAVGLVDLFWEITTATYRERVTPKNITDFMCEVALPTPRR